MEPHKDIAHHPNDKRRFPKPVKHPLMDQDGHMVYQDKHWRTLSELDPMQIDNIEDGQSQATRMIAEGECDGVLHLSGKFLEKHKEEIMGIIHHMGEHAKLDDVTNEIVNVEEHGPDKTTVYTVKNQLAVRMGKKISESYKGGELKIHWSKNDMPVEVWWHKDMD
ncbi:MAG TPA: hypothetical protein VI588_02750 [Candidatus Gracilibacteria bacterium]|nr:hypothetical protein [Candidatus Gracilibacteria bacterium]